MATLPPFPGTTGRRGDTDDVGVIGENVNEDLLPHHIRSDVQSVSDAPAHRARP